MSFYHELRTLSPLPEYQAAIDLIESGTLPIHERQVLIVQALRAIAPPVPDGKRRMKECFWAVLFSFASIAVASSVPYRERKAKWMREKRERAQRSGEVWPPRGLVQHNYFDPSRYEYLLRMID